MTSILLQIVAALERKFPEHNHGFAYGTRLCEETGELAEALMNFSDNATVPDAKLQLVKECQDVLRVVLGIAKTYGVQHDIVIDFQCDTQESPDVMRLVVQLAAAAGNLANAINHAEGSLQSDMEREIHAAHRRYAEQHLL
ncbi:hypothetical protein JNJ66_01285 [Candidatus Saccharibacteria bacterium]|nr:hypothetical protein [Candidatus Saccharibacteria bacterium]